MYYDNVSMVRHSIWSFAVAGESDNEENACVMLIDVNVYVENLNYPKSPFPIVHLSRAQHLDKRMSQNQKYHELQLKTFRLVDDVTGPVHAHVPDLILLFASVAAAGGYYAEDNIVYLPG